MQIVYISTRHKHYSALMLDDGRTVLIDSDIVAENGISKGQSIDEETLYKLMQLSDKRRAYENALYILEYRSHSKRELETKLRQKGYSPEGIEDALHRIEQLGLIDDLSFAQNYCEELLRRGFGKRRIYDEFYKKGISRDIAEQVIESVECDPVKEVAEIIVKRFNPLPNEEKERRRMYLYLTRRGFTFEDIRSAVSEISEQAIFEDDNI